jgi:hypothetical protein
MGDSVTDSGGQQGEPAVARGRARVWPCLRKRAVALAGAATALAAPALAWGQGCPLCYTAAAAAKAGGIQALRSGILILMIPPMLIFATLSVVAIRRRNAFRC